jgi:hypothetical protein
MKLYFKLHPIHGKFSNLGAKQPVSIIVVDKNSSYYGRVLMIDASIYKKFPEAFSRYDLKKIG